MSDKSVLFLFLIKALKETNKAHPKNTNELIRDIEALWQERFKDEKLETLSPSTIGRHIKSINQSGLYDIKSCKNTKDGYYMNKFPFTAAEFSIIAQALCRSVAISNEETTELMQKFMYLTDDLGENFLDIYCKQIRRAFLRRKPSVKTLPIINIIMQAIWEQKKIKFKYYEKHDRDANRMKLIKDYRTNKIKEYIVSPYYLVWDNDDCYLIAHDSNLDNGEEKRLSHFRVSLLAEAVKLNAEVSCSIAEMKEYPRYCMRVTIPEEVAIVKRKKEAINREDYLKLDRLYALVRFSLDRYMRENIFMAHDNSPLVDLRLHFREDFVGTIATEFNMSRRIIKMYPNGHFFADGEPIISAVITAQDNEGLYRWLMKYANEVTVAEPESVRTKLKIKLRQSLDTIEAYERDTYDKLTPEELKQEQREMWQKYYWDELMTNLYLTYGKTIKKHKNSTDSLS